MMNLAAPTQRATGIIPAMPLIAYLDETGDHTLESVDKDFPVFALVMFVCDADYYCMEIVPAVTQLKMDYFGHDCVILHSCDIRKQEKAFIVLRRSQDYRDGFYERINEIMSDHEYRLVPVVIKKQAHREKHGSLAENPYQLALKHAMYGLAVLLSQENQSEVTIVAEARGKNEDQDLRACFNDIVHLGAEGISASELSQITFNLVFAKKSANIVGTQLADLAAYPIARFVIDPGKKNRPFETIKEKLYLFEGWTNGIKVCP
jgi:Protein of unknown function (DUF3800)